METTTTERRKAGLAEIVLQELLHLAAALADQPDHRNIGRDIAASIDSSTDLPTPEPEKMPMRWPRQQVDEGVDRAHAEIERLADAPARMRRRRRVAEG